MKTTYLRYKGMYSKWVLLAFALLGNAAGAQQPTTYTEQSKLFRAPNAFSQLGTDLFGDKVNLYTGSLEFLQTQPQRPSRAINKQGKKQLVARACASQNRV